MEPLCLRVSVCQLSRREEGKSALLTLSMPSPSAGHVQTAVYMEALANHLDTDRGNAHTWGELLGCLESWCAAAETQPPTTLAPPSASAVRDPTAVSTGGLAPQLPLTSAPPFSVLDPSISSGALPAAAGGAVLDTQRVVSNEKESVRGGESVEREAGRSEGTGPEGRGQDFGVESERDRQLAGVRSARQEGEGSASLADQHASTDGRSDVLRKDGGGVLEIADGAAQEISNTWLWRMDAWRDQHFGREAFEEESATILSSVNMDQQAEDGAGADEDTAFLERGANVRKVVSPGRREATAEGATEGRGNASSDEPLLERVSRVGSKAGVSAFLSGAENEYTQGVLKLFREEGPGRLGGERLTKELEARCERAGRCTRALERERRRRDEAHWGEVRRRELVLRAKRREFGNRLDMGLERSERVGSEFGLLGKGGESADGVSGQVGLNAGLQLTGAQSLVEEGQRVRGSKTLDAVPGTPKGGQNPEGPRISEEIRKSVEVRTANAAGGSSSGGGEVGGGSVEAAVKEEIAGFSTGVQGVGAEQTTTEAGPMETIMDECNSQLKDEGFDEDGFGALEIADEWLAAIEAERMERDLAEFVAKSKREGKKRRRRAKEKGRASRVGEGRRRRETGDADRSGEESGEASRGSSEGSGDKSNDGSDEESGETGRGAGKEKQLTARQRALVQRREEQGREEEGRREKAPPSRKQRERGRQEEAKTGGGASVDHGKADGNEVRADTDASSLKLKNVAAEPNGKRQKLEQGRSRSAEKIIGSKRKGSEGKEAQERQDGAEAAASGEAEKRQHVDEAAASGEAEKRQHVAEDAASDEEKARSDDDMDDLACNKCGRRDDGHVMVLCDGEKCETALHIYCMPRPLKAVPRGKWYCPRCRKKPRYAWKTRK
jgi:hypothetical protein